MMGNYLLWRLGMVVVMILVFAMFLGIAHIASKVVDYFKCRWGAKQL